MDEKLTSLIDETKGKASKLTFSFEFMISGRTNFPMESIITFSNGFKIGIKAMKIENSLYILPCLSPYFDGTSDEEKENVSFLLDFWEKYMEIYDLNICFAQRKWFEDILNKNFCSNLFQSFSFKLIEQDVAKVLNDYKIIHKQADGWIKERLGNQVTNISEVLHEMESSILSYQEKEPTLHIEGSLKSGNIFRYYFEGHNGILNFTYDHTGFQFKESELKIELKSEEIKDIKNSIHELFDSVKRKCKIKTIFNPPKFHFKRLANALHIYPFSSSELIYAELLKTMSPHEIETVCAIQHKSQKLISFSKENFQFLVIGDHVFVMNKEILLHDSIQNINEAYQYYVQSVINEVNSHLVQQKNSLLKHYF